MVSTTKTILQHSFDLRPEYHYHCGQGGKLSRPSIQKKQKFIQPRECHTHRDWCTWTISHRIKTPGTGRQIYLTPSKVHGCQPSLVMITFYVKCCTSQLKEAAETWLIRPWGTSDNGGKFALRIAKVITVIAILLSLVWLLLLLLLLLKSHSIYSSVW